MSDLSDLSKVNPEEINSEGEKWGQSLSQAGIKPTQIRNIYSSVQQIRVQKDRLKDEDISRRLTFLKPKLAYASGRQPGMKPLRSFLVQAIDGVVKSAEFRPALENFFMLMEAIVAYHKFHTKEKS